MKRSQLDALWQEAEEQSRNEGAMYSRYHFAALVIANHPPQSSMTWQVGYEAGKQAEREACLAGVKKVFGTFDSLPQSPEINLVRSLTSTFFEAIELEIEQRSKL